MLSKVQADQLTAAASRDRLMVAMTIRMARAALGWSQAELGRLLGMSQRAIHRIEQGHSAPRRTTLLAIESLLERAGLKIEDRGDGGFCMIVPAAVLGASLAGAAASDDAIAGEAGLPVRVIAPSLSDPDAGEDETMEPASSGLLR
jgi:transcriptional regulator with XRE-family HTH domain